MRRKRRPGFPAVFGCFYLPAWNKRKAESWPRHQDSQQGGLGLPPVSNNYVRDMTSETGIPNFTPTIGFDATSRRTMT